MSNTLWLIFYALVALILAYLLWLGLERFAEGAHDLWCYAYPCWRDHGINGAPI